MVSILSVDGGGIRGIIPAIMVVPGLLALIIVGAGAYLYYRKGNS